MGRTVDQHKQFIYDQIALKPSLALLVSNPSQVAIWKDFVHCIATQMAALEQLQDQFKTDVEDTINTASVHNLDFVRKQAFYFQYDASVPQVITFKEVERPTVTIPVYDPEDATKRIISVCVLRVTTSRVLEIFVAKNNPPVKLSVAELAAFQGYYTDGGTSTDLAQGVGVGGIAYDCKSLDPDYVFLEGTIYHQGQFAATIEADTILAIENYLYNLGKDGILVTTKLIDALQKNVPGFVNIDIVNLAIRANGTLFASKTYLIQASAVLLIQKEAAAGYAYQEITALNTFTDKLTFTVA